MQEQFIYIIKIQANLPIDQYNSLYHTQPFHLATVFPHNQQEPHVASRKYRNMLISNLQQFVSLHVPFLFCSTTWPQNKGPPCVTQGCVSGRGTSRALRLTVLRHHPDPLCFQSCFSPGLLQYIKRGRWNREGHSLHSGVNIITNDLTEYFRESSGAKLQGATRIPSMIRGMSSRQPRPILKGVGFSTVSSGGDIYIQ